MAVATHRASICIDMNVHLLLILFHTMIHVQQSVCHEQQVLQEDAGFTSVAVIMRSDTQQHSVSLSTALIHSTVVTVLQNSLMDCQTKAIQCTGV